MCLAAAGRAGLSTSPPTGSGPAERPRGASKASKPISCLAYLSTAVGCLASNSPNAAKLLVQLCTQVELFKLDSIKVRAQKCTFSGFRLSYLGNV